MATHYFFDQRKDVQHFTNNSRAHGWVSVLYHKGNTDSFCSKVQSCFSARPLCLAFISNIAHTMESLGVVHSYELSSYFLCLSPVPLSLLLLKFLTACSLKLPGM